MPYDFSAFIKQYIRKSRTVGAILPSSKYIASRMIENIDFNTAKYIVEYGPGTGVSSNILKQTQKCLKEEGKFITFQYTLLKKDFIKKYFNEISIKREIRNVPPAYVLCCNL